MIEDKKIALLIDSENISAKYIKYIFSELSKYGTTTIKRIYGDWTDTKLDSWKKLLLDFSITPMQQYRYTSGKNSTDSAMIIDAMDILYSGNVDGFCLASSDSDFTRLAARLREAGMLVIGMGEKKTPLPFVNACEKYVYLEMLLPKKPSADKSKAENKSKPKPSKKQEKTVMDRDGIVSVIKEIIESVCDDTSWAYLGDVFNDLNKRFPDFDPRLYGYKNASNFVSSLPDFVTEKRSVNGGNTDSIFIKIAPQQ